MNKEYDPYLTCVDLPEYMFFEKVSINFRKSNNSICRWTVLLGENGTGKTSLLRLISGWQGIKYFFNKLDGFCDSVLTSFKDKLEKFMALPEKIDNNFFSSLSIKYGYGVGRYSSSDSFEKSVIDDCSSLFSSSVKLLNLSGWILKMYLAKKNGNKNALRQYKMLRSLICEGGLFEDVTDFKVVTDDKYDSKVMFKTCDGWFEYEQLASGYQTMLSWVGDFCYRMFDRYKDSENPLHEPAIVLIDEIDLNLHPEWQRKIVPLLSEAFPNTQFIATTHSPFVIQSMEDVNLYVLSRDENGKGLITRVPGNNFTGWSVEEILTDIMGLDERINSDKYNELMAKFDDGLDNDDKQKVEEAYSALCAILPPNSKTRKVIDYQKKKVC